MLLLDRVNTDSALNSKVQILITVRQYSLTTRYDSTCIYIQPIRITQLHNIIRLYRNDLQAIKGWQNAPEHRPKYAVTDVERSTTQLTQTRVRQYRPRTK